MSNTINICDFKIERGQKLHTFLQIPDTTTEIPVTIINGKNAGPVLLITAGIHGAEYPGIAAAIELGRDIVPEDIYGCLIIIHPVNIQCFWARREFIVPEDSKNLNREFPGNASGTLSEKIAYLLSKNFFSVADFYLDLHSGDIHEELYPYVYYPGLPNADISSKSRDVAKVLDMKYMVKSTATTGAYNYAAIAGVPSLLIERGGNGLCPRSDIEDYKNDIYRVMHKLGLVKSTLPPQSNIPIDVEDVIYLESNVNGCWLPNFHSSDRVKSGDELGRLTDVFGKIIAVYHAKQDGVILYQCSALAAPKGTILVAYGKI